MAIDGGLRTLFREKLRAGFHWQSIETGGTGLGVPDSNYCCGGIEGWVEFKQTEGWVVTLRPEQVGWIIARTTRGGRVTVAVRRQHAGGVRRGEPQDQLWLLRGSAAMELQALGLRGGVGVIGCWDGGPARWDWDAVRVSLLT